MKVTKIRYFNTLNGVGYECHTNIDGVRICNHGTGGATFIDGAFKDTKNFRELSEWDLEDLIDKYENKLLTQ